MLLTIMANTGLYCTVRPCPVLLTFLGVQDSVALVSQFTQRMVGKFTRILVDITYVYRILSTDVSIPSLTSVPTDHLCAASAVLV